MGLKKKIEKWWQGELVHRATPISGFKFLPYTKRPFIAQCYEKLLKLSWLGSFSSVFYAFIYILLIPFFALIFTQLPRDFYHSSIKHEKSFMNETFALPDDLFKRVREQFELKYHENILSQVELEEKNYPGYFSMMVPYEVGDWFIFIDTLKSAEHTLRDAINISDKSLEFNGRILVQSKKADELNQLNFNLKFIPEYRASKFSRNYEATMGDDYSEYNSGYTLLTPGQVAIKGFGRLIPSDKPFAVREDDVTKLVKIIFLNDFKGNGDEPVFFKDTDYFNKRLMTYFDASNGFPSDIAGGYFRMLYFSAVTITTLGYGDIIPITPLSRMLIAIESLLGIIVIGLFLNALSRESKR